MTRAEHIEWCKKRANEYLDKGEAQEGLTSMLSDIRKHPETETHAGIQLAMMVMMDLNIPTVRKWVNGFN